MSSSQVQDDSQLRRLQEYGVVELARLFEAERERLKKTINYGLGTGLAAPLDASDIVQETYVAASKSLKSI